MTSATVADGALAGSPAYMSPEQWSGEAVDAASDQVSFCDVWTRRSPTDASGHG